MANWCYNQITFSGDESKVKEITQLFIDMNNESEKIGLGTLPKFITEVEDSHFFDIYADESSDIISYLTKWAPNLSECTKIANHYGVGFELLFSESGMCIFGKAILVAGHSQATILELTEKDQEQIVYDEESNAYIYNGESYECEEEALELLFKHSYNQNY